MKMTPLSPNFPKRIIQFDRRKAEKPKIDNIFLFLERTPSPLKLVNYIAFFGEKDIQRYPKKTTDFVYPGFPSKSMQIQLYRFLAL